MQRFPYYLISVVSKLILLPLKKRFLILLLFYFLPVYLFSQIAYLKNYTTKDGLPSNEVYQVIQDSKGYMWFATDFGVSRFDGYKFTNFDSKDGLPDNTVFEIYEDYKGRLWFISSSAKLSYYFNDSIFLYKYNNALINNVKDVPNILNKSFSVDEQDNVYIGIYRHGHYKISKNGNITKRFSMFPANDNAFIVKKNKVYFNTPPKAVNDNIFYVIKDKCSFKYEFEPESFPGRRYLLLGLNNEIYYSYTLYTEFTIQ